MTTTLVKQNFSFIQSAQKDQSWISKIKYTIGGRFTCFATAIALTSRAVVALALTIFSAFAYYFSFRKYRSFLQFSQSQFETSSQLFSLIPACLTGIYSPKLMEKKLIFGSLKAEIRECRLRFGEDLIQKKLKTEWDCAQEAMRLEEDHEEFIFTEDPDVESDDEDETTPKYHGPHAVGSCHFIGRRDEMEDEELAVNFTLQIGEKIYPAQLFGIFDGHGGVLAAQFLKNHLKEELEKTLLEFNSKKLTDEGIWNALKITFVRLDEKFQQDTSGSTAVICLILDGKVWTANVGDSRAILENNGQIQQLSLDAKPSDERFKRGIENRGGFVRRLFRTPRVNGILATARALGDHQLGKAMSARPKITMTQATPGMTLILACDGIYDVASTRQVGNAAQDNPDLPPTELAQNLVYSAFEAGSTDNLSALVIKLFQGSQSKQ